MTKRFPVFGDDTAEQARSAERLRLLRDAGHTVLPGHDPEVLRPRAGHGGGLATNVLIPLCRVRTRQSGTRRNFVSKMSGRCRRQVGPMTSRDWCG